MLKPKNKELSWIITGGTGDCHNDNNDTLWCHQWAQSGLHDNFRFSVMSQTSTKHNKAMCIFYGMYWPPLPPYCNIPSFCLCLCSFVESEVTLRPVWLWQWDVSVALILHTRPDCGQYRPLRTPNAYIALSATGGYWLQYTDVFQESLGHDDVDARLSSTSTFIHVYRILLQSLQV